MAHQKEMKKSSIVVMVMAMLVMASAVSGARILVGIDNPAIIGSLNAGTISATGTTAEPMNGCVKDATTGLEACGHAANLLDANGSVKVKDTNIVSGQLQVQPAP